MADVEFEAIRDAILSHALTTGHFDNVAGHEPKNAPGKGIIGALYVGEIRPSATASGLSATSLSVSYSFRIYKDMLSEPQDAIDPDVCSAALAFMRNLSADFTLDGLVREVDLLGSHADELAGRTGYLDQDGRKFRVLVVTLSVGINDVFEQSP